MPVSTVASAAGTGRTTFGIRTSYRKVPLMVAPVATTSPPPAAVGPSNGSPVADPIPSAEWPTDRLATYARNQIGESGAIEASLGLMARRSTVAFFRAGQALAIARDRLKASNGWEQWLKNHHIPKTTAFEAIKLAENAKDESAVATLALTEAKRRYGVSGSTTAAERAAKAEQRKLAAAAQPQMQTAKVTGDPTTFGRLLAVAETALIAARDAGRGAEGDDLAEARRTWDRVNGTDGVLADLARVFAAR